MSIPGLFPHPSRPQIASTFAVSLSVDQRLTQWEQFCLWCDRTLVGKNAAADICSGPLAQADSASGYTHPSKSSSCLLSLSADGSCGPASWQWLCSWTDDTGRHQGLVSTAHARSQQSSRICAGGVTPAFILNSSLERFARLTVM